VTSVVILTSDELRHHFMRMCLALDPELEVLTSFCEAPTASLASLLDARDDVDELERSHLEARAAAEQDFFATFCRAAPDLSRPVRIDRGEINQPVLVERITQLRPDVVATFGCSLVGPDLIEAFPDRIINLHLGLSPYYRGSGTNLWPLVLGEPELVGATFMYLDAGIDTGEIIHQLRARIVPGDDAHRIGNRLIADAALAFRKVLVDVGSLGHLPQPEEPERARSFRRAQVDAAVLKRLQTNIASGMIEEYLADRERRDAASPIVAHPLFGGRPR
jgi:folate-dependent phosphoribosylglycinamide formyltransferase PurN